jgi:N-carbamoylputrescine amidase
MKIALVQQQASHDLAANRRRGLDAVAIAAEAGAELVAFAELAFDPFYPQRQASEETLQAAEPIPGATVDAFREAARRHGVVIVLNLFERDGERTYDSSPVIDADGTLLGTTRMIHITDYPCFREQGYYAPGDTGAPVWDTRVGRIGVAICYDRHYPEYMRALGVAGAELVVVPQAGAVGEWPEGLFAAPLRLAASHTGSPPACVKRVGEGAALTFAGESFVCVPAGRVVTRAGAGAEQILFADLDRSACDRSHARRLFYRDRRPELYAGWIDP